MLYKFENKTIVVTGGSGYIGSAIIQKLIGNAKKIIRVSRKLLPPKIDVEDWRLDLQKIDAWLRIVKEADIIIHLAVNTSLFDSEKNPNESYISSQLPVSLLIKASHKLNYRPRIVFASTATVYGMKDSLPVTEDSEKIPITVYDNHKLLIEEQLAIATKERIVSAISLRLANVYGPSQSESGSADRGILSKIVKKSITEQKIQIYGAGKQLRDYIYIDDVVDAFLSVCLIKTSHVAFNVASGKGTSLNEVFSLIASEVTRCSGNNVNINYLDWPIDINEIEKRNFIGSIELLKSESEWTPTINIKDGVRLLVENYAKSYK